MKTASLSALAMLPAARLGLDAFDDKRPRVAVLWPKPRRGRVAASLADSALHEEADAFTWLRDNGLGFAMLESTPWPWNPLARHGSALAGIDPLRALRLALNWFRIDAVVSMDSSSALLYALARRVFRIRKPLIVVDPALTVSYRLRRQIHDLVLPAADCAVVFASVQERYLNERYGGRVRSRFVRHRIDLRFFDLAKARPAPPAAAPYALCVGDDIGRDFTTLIRAFEGLGLPLVVKSSRPLPEPLPPNVRVIREHIGFDRLRDLYAHARLVALPLHDTLHPSGINSLLESMAMRRPVIVTDSQGVADYVENGRTACVTPCGDAAALRSAVVSLWSDEARRDSLGAGARRFCESHCGMPYYMRQISSIIASCLK